MKSLQATGISIALLAAMVGCTYDHTASQPDGRHHSDLLDALFMRRPIDPHAHVHHDPVMAFARQVTEIEDDLRRDGTITVKQPDVWGDGNLMYFLQEYDQILEQRTKLFSETLQGYIARSDQMDLQSTTGISAALSPSSKAPTVTSIDIDNKTVLEAIAVGKLPGVSQTSLSIEPTETARQHSTYVDVCQALRRRHMGDDTSRAAGYGLYKFRIPVSVLPGRETSQGHSAIVNLRAQLEVDEAHLRYTYPKLVIADLVDKLAPYIHSKWTPATGSKPKRVGAESIGMPISANVASIFSDSSLKALQGLAQAYVATEYEEEGKPKIQELRAFLSHHFGQVHAALEKNGAYANGSEIIDQAGELVARGQFGDLETSEKAWLKSVASMHADLCQSSWMLAVQSGILNQNLLKILEELKLKGRLAPEDCSLAESGQAQFYNPLSPVRPQVLHLWQTIVREEFPIHVFTLDPQVEEQNVYDAFMRRREMQLALAYSVAKGNFNAEQKLALSRQLALDEVSMGLNRTVVGFSHGNDTFGWYFHPRLQSPPTESTNIGALARMIWSTGPTEHYDLKHRKLEPGMRECEVLIAMPSFVNRVSFDVTTNWERIAHPGVTKRSYEEMVAQGSRVHRLKLSLACVGDDACLRPGDLARLASRVDQLEQMLGMQTYQVNVPYEYEQSGADLFDTGDVHLRPVVTGYYGLEYLPGATDAQVNGFFFVTGKNFHPTLTHVIAGGVEAHSLVTVDQGTEKGQFKTSWSADVEVISRELIRVKVPGINAKLSDSTKGIQVRVGTPAGLSSPLHIPIEEKKPAKQEVTVAPPAKGFFFDDKLKGAISASVCLAPGKKIPEIKMPAEHVSIFENLDDPMPHPVGACQVILRIQTYRDGKVVPFGSKEFVDTDPIAADALLLPSTLDPLTASQDLQVKMTTKAFQEKLQVRLDQIVTRLGRGDVELRVTGYILFDRWPAVATREPLVVPLIVCCEPPEPIGPGRVAPGSDGMLPSPMPMPTPGPMPTPAPMPDPAPVPKPAPMPKSAPSGKPAPGKAEELPHPGQAPGAAFEYGPAPLPVLVAPN